jgi:RNA polymerase sigma factor (sigma-70 family)
MAPIRDEAAELDIEFSRLYRTYSYDLRRFAVYLSGDPALADDMVSEAFARAWTTRDRIEFSTVRGYLFAIVRNLFLHHRRQAWRRQDLDERMIDRRPGPETSPATRINCDSPWRRWPDCRKSTGRPS